MGPLLCPSICQRRYKALFHQWRSTKYYNESLKNSHLSRWTRKLNCSSLPSTTFKFLRWAVWFSPVTKMSSKKQWTLDRPCRTWSMTSLKIDGAGVMPNGRRLWQNIPFCVVIVRYLQELSWTGTCKYACVRSNLLKPCTPTSNANRSSIVRIG